MAEQQPDEAGSPARMVELFEGFMVSAALKAGLDLEVFTHIAHGVDSAEKLAAAKKVPLRAMRILCDALAGCGALRKSDGVYSLPPLSQMTLVKGSPAYLGPMAGVMMDENMWDEAGRLTEIIKAGHALMEHGAEMPDNPFWQKFSQSSKQTSMMMAPAVADIAAGMFPKGPPRRILDVAVGSGIYGFTALQHFPAAQLVSVDWANVLKLAEPIAAQMEVAGRVEFRPGDIFTVDLGTGYDLILAVSIYHHFDMEKNLELSRRLHQAAAPGGRLLIVDMVPDEKREHSRSVLFFALRMLMWTKGGDTYTFSEYERMLKAAGWRDVERRPFGGREVVQSSIVARK